MEVPFIIVLKQTYFANNKTTIKDYQYIRILQFIWLPIVGPLSQNTSSFFYKCLYKLDIFDLCVKCESVKKFVVGLSDCKKKWKKVNFPFFVRK